MHQNQQTLHKYCNISKPNVFQGGGFFGLFNQISFDSLSYFYHLSPTSNSENMSKPEISFEVYKDVEGNFANVTCQVTKGSPPINFTLFKTNDSVISQFQYTSFVVPIVLDQKMDTVHCQASNGKTPLQSRELNLTVGM